MKFIQASWEIACIKNLSDRCEKKKDGIYTTFTRILRPSNP